MGSTPSTGSTSSPQASSLRQAQDKQGRQAHYRLGLIGFIFPAGAGREDFIGPCYTNSCVHFGFSGFGFVLALYWVCIGFVFTQFAIGNIFIIHSMKRGYVHLDFLEIGFVLHKVSDL